MAARFAVLTAGVVALLVVSGCSDDEAPDTGSSDEVTATSTGPTSTSAPGGPPTTMFPNTPVTAGSAAVVTGAYETVAVPEGESDVESDTPAEEDACHLLRTDDDDVVTLSFSDLYVHDGTSYPGPPDYEGNPEDYESDAALAHSGDRLIVRGEVAEVEDPCTQLSSHSGLVLLVEAWARP